MTTRTVTQTWNVAGVLTDATTAKLSDPTAAYGVKRDDTDAVVVADGTDMTRISAGVYQYSFAEPEEGLAFTGYVEIVYGGETYYFAHEIEALIPAGEMAANYTELRKAIGHEMGLPGDVDLWTTDEESAVHRYMRSGLQRFYNAPGYVWTFLQPEDTIATVEPYSTGTIGVVDGVVTLATGTWPSWTEGALLCVNGEYYPVVSRDSDSQITLDDLTLDVDASTSYTLGKYIYDLPADFSRFDGKLRPRSPAYALWGPVIHATAAEVRKRLSDDPQFDYPLIVAIRAKTFTATVGQRYQAIFYPIPDAAYTFFYTYRVTPTMITATNQYPLGGAEHSETILQACLAAAELGQDRVAGVHAAEFERLLAASVANDRDHHSPVSVGVDHGLEDGMDDRFAERVSGDIYWSAGGGVTDWI